MIYALLFASALLFFILDRKISNSIIPGTLVTLTTWWVLLHTIAFKISLSDPYNSMLYSSRYRVEMNTAIRALSLINLSIIITLISAAAFFALAKSLGKLLFKDSEDSAKATKNARLLFIIASAAVSLSGLYFLFINLSADRRNNFASITNIFGDTYFEFFYQKFPMDKIASIFYIVLGIIFIVLIIAKLFSIKELKPAVSETQPVAQKNTLLIAGIIISAVGNLVSLIRALIKINAYKRGLFVLLGSSTTSFLTFVSFILIIAGLIILSIAVCKVFASGQKPPIIAIVISDILLALSVVDSAYIILSFSQFLASSLNDFQLDPMLLLNMPSYVQTASIVLMLISITGLIVMTLVMLKKSAK